MFDHPCDCKTTLTKHSLIADKLWHSMPNQRQNMFHQKSRHFCWSRHGFSINPAPWHKFFSNDLGLATLDKAAMAEPSKGGTKLLRMLRPKDVCNMLPVNIENKTYNNKNKNASTVKLNSPNDMFQRQNNQVKLQLLVRLAKTSWNAIGNKFPMSSPIFSNFNWTTCTTHHKIPSKPPHCKVHILLFVVLQ